ATIGLLGRRARRAQVHQYHSALGHGISSRSSGWRRSLPQAAVRAARAPSSAKTRDNLMRRGLWREALSVGKEELPPQGNETGRGRRWGAAQRAILLRRRQSAECVEDLAANLVHITET